MRATGSVARAARLAVATAALVIGVSAQPTGTPDEARRRNNLGVALMDAGAKDPRYFVEGVSEFEAALRLAPRYRTARLNLGLALYYAGQPGRADAALKDAASEDPDEPRAQYVLGLLREYDGSFDAAAGHFRRVTVRDPADPDAWYHLGFCLGKAGRPGDAVEPLRRAATLVPYQRRVRYGLYMALSRAGRSQEAQQELDRFRALDTAQIRVVEGPKNTLEYLKQGRYAEAVADSRQPAPPPAPARYSDVTRAAGLVAPVAPMDPRVAAALQGEPVRAAELTDAVRAGLASALAESVSFADVDHDGRLDIAYIYRGALRLYLQTAAGHFTRAQVPALASAINMPTALAWGDLDNDGWADLVVGGVGRVIVLNNRRGRLVASTRGPGSAVPSTFVPAGLTLADIDHDGDLDVLAAGGVQLDRAAASDRVRYPDDFEPRPNLLLRNNGDGTFVDVAREAGLQSGPFATRGAWFVDLDDDHAIDAVLVDAHGRGHAFLNRKDGTFAPTESAALPAIPRVMPGEARAEGDVNGDGGIDRLVADRAGVRLEQNVSAPAHWLTVRVAGYAVPGKVKSNALGIGTRVEVRTAGRWERKDIRAGNGAGGSDAAEATFDLGTDARLDFVRAVFPSGVRKTLRDVAANQAVRIDEPLLDVNSCPTLFTWNGQRFAFVTDTLGAGILGELVAPGEYWSPDSDEWVRITADQLAPTPDGRLDIRFTNPLEEVTYLDQVRLLAVDHPDGLQVFSDDRMLNAPDRREPVRLYVVQHERPVARAEDHHGHDVTALVGAVDRRYVDHFAATPFKGFAGEWSLTLDLGEVRSGGPTVLGLDGWSYWNSSASIVAAAQAGQTLWGPALDVRGRGGIWRRATGDVGLPAGLPRPMIVDLAPYLRPGEHVVRIRGNRTIYYDRAWVADVIASAPLAGITGTGSASVRVTEAALRHADLRWLGYPRRTLPDGRFPEVFDYSAIEQEADWQTPAGLLTRYGSVEPLLRANDDRFVVMGHGEETVLDFDARGLPPVGPGWQRTWFFFSDGFEKGSELYSAAGTTVGPLPYHAMGAYPETADGAPVDSGYLGYLLDWNTRPSFMRR